MKHGLVLMVGAVLLAWSLVGCVSDDDDDGEGELVAFSVVESGQNSGVGTERLTVIREQALFDDLWQEHAGGAAFLTPPAPPLVDFNQRMVLAIFLGERTTDRHRIEVFEVREHSANFTVKVRVTLPDEGCAVFDEDVQPFQMVTIPQSDKVVGFTTEVRLGCP